MRQDTNQLFLTIVERKKMDIAVNAVITRLTEIIRYRDLREWDIQTMRDACDVLKHMGNRISELQASKDKETIRLRRIVDKLPRTADQVPVVPRDKLWVPCNTAGYYGQPAGKAVEVCVSMIGTDATPLQVEHHDGTERQYLACRLHSTRESAEARAQ